MKFLKHIFTATFLLGMLFTVIQSISMDEEAMTKTELSKKSSGSESKDGSTEDSNADGDDEANDLLNGFFDYDWSTFNLDTELYDHSNRRFISSYANITTPPPKV